MKNNINYHIGEFLFRFFRKHSASFLANIYKAGITGTAKDIHRARLDVKKIFAILDLLSIVRLKNEKEPGYDRLFKKLYTISGKIREIQVNFLLLSKPEFTIYDMNPYKLNLLLQERERTGEFLKTIRKFDEKELAWVEKRIKKEVYKIKPVTLKKKTNHYIRAKTAVIIALFEKENDEQNLHKVRQHLKELSTVLSLVINVKPSGKLEQTIAGLNKSEMMIGEWHDKVVMADSLENFLNHVKNLDESQLAQVREFRQKIAEDNKIQVDIVINEVKRLIQAGFSDENLRVV